MPFKDPEKKKKYNQEYAAKHRKSLKVYHRRHYENNAEKQKESARLWYRENREKVKAWNAARRKSPEGRRTIKNCDLKRNFGITLAEFEQKFAMQNGLCAICEKPETRKNRSLCVDHNHETGKVRGLLCSFCNLAIGHLHEDEKLFLAAIKYLQAYK